MLKHIVLSQKNAERNRKCIQTAARHMEQTTVVNTDS